MTRMTESQYEAYLDKRGLFLCVDDSTPDAGPESRLQGKIVKWAKDHGFPCLSFRQSRKAKGFLTPGWPDITMAIHNNRVLFLELKAKKGVLRKEQTATGLQLTQLGHEWHQVKSFKRFLQIVGKGGA